ncbi:hypothetical protein M0802_016417 [Mischocyttarus mexicanus]|nr:hypothetical protein M0802_016417 [Mischocyttarus mexicanus]
MTYDLHQKCNLHQMMGKKKKRPSKIFSGVPMGLWELTFVGHTRYECTASSNQTEERKIKIENTIKLYFEQNLFHAKRSRAKQSKAKQSKAEQSRAEQSRAKQSKAELS